MATATGTAANGLPYVGNADYRGYLSALSQGGDTNATTALNYVGNDGVWNPNQSTVPLSSTGAAAAKAANQQYYYNWVTGGSSGSGSGSGSGTPDTTASDLAYLDNYDTSLRGQLQSAQSSLGQGMQQIADSYNENTTRTNQDRNTADTGFNTNRTQTTQDKLKAQDQINTNARTLSDSVRSMLGLAGGTNSSAYQYAAPAAIARDTTQKTTSNSDTYGRNFDAIDSARGASDLKFQRALQDLTDQRKQKESGLTSGVLDQENQITQQLAQNALTRGEVQGGTYAKTAASLAPFTNDMASRQAAIDGLFAQYRTPYALQDTTPVAANTSTFTPTQTNIQPAQPGQASNSGDNSTYLQALLKKFQAPAAAPVAATA